ncbi:MAG TPA: hypothetical protein VFC94_05125 [Bacteroidaceae bacterium]|nr:hypothetical protein [Bacteroidaceae bacterium]
MIPQRLTASFASGSQKLDFGVYPPALLFASIDRTAFRQSPDRQASSVRRHPTEQQCKNRLNDRKRVID